VVDLTVFVEKTGDEGCGERGAEGRGEWCVEGHLGIPEEELVSCDFKGNSHSSIVDAEYTKVVGDRCGEGAGVVRQRVGYSCRCRDLIKLLASKF